MPMYLQSCNMFHYTPRPTYLVGGYIGFTVSVRPSVHPRRRPSSASSVGGMVSGHFLGCFCTDLPEIQNDYVFWYKEETHEGDFQKFEICYFGRIYVDLGLT